MKCVHCDGNGYYIGALTGQFVDCVCRDHEPVEGKGRDMLSFHDPDCVLPENHEGECMSKADVLEKDNTRLRAELADLRSRALAAVERAAEANVPDCGICGANWLDHQVEECE